jgi:DDB1- and CUL4-associated factor 1
MHSLFQVGKKLSELIRDTSAQTLGGDSGRWQAELTHVAIELIGVRGYALCDCRL